MEEKIKELDKKGMRLCLKNGLEFGLIIFFGVFGLNLLSMNLIGVMIYFLVELILFKQLKNTLYKIDIVNKRLRKLNEKKKRNEKIEDIKVKFNALSKEKQKEFLEFVKTDEELKKIFFEIEELELEDKLILQEYFDNCVFLNKVDGVSRQVVAPKIADAGLEQGKVKSRKRVKDK